MQNNILVQSVVLSGGSGTRLWPLSREKYPKQLLSLVGQDSLLQATVRRVVGTPGVTLAAPMVVCNEEYRFVIAEQLRLLGQSGAVVLEPFGRNTAPALTLAALAAIKNAADPVLLVMPADHVITDVGPFRRWCGRGQRWLRPGRWSPLASSPILLKSVMATSRPGQTIRARLARQRASLPGLLKSPTSPPRRPTWQTAAIPGTAACS